MKVMFFFTEFMESIHLSKFFFGGGESDDLFIH